MKLPFGDDEFDAVTISFGLRNVQDPKQALAEMYRVLKPGGRLIVCEFSKPPRALLRAGKPKCRTRSTLVMPQRTVPRIRDCRVREDHLMRGERARILRRDVGPSAKERDLESERLAAPGKPSRKALP